MLVELENELVALVKASALKSRVKVIDSLPEADGEALVKRFATEAPAVYVAPAGVPRISGGIATVRYSVAAVARNARGQKEARQGDGKLIGLNEMLDSLLVLLDDASTASASWGTTGISLSSEELFYKNGLYVGAVGVEAAIGISKDIERSTLDDFLRAYVNYDLAPYEPYVLLSGAPGSYVHTPDAAANRVGADPFLVLRFAADDWTPAADVVLASKWLEATNQRAWALSLKPTGQLRWRTSANGAAVAVDVTSPGNLAALGNGTAKYMGVKHDTDNGAGGNTVEILASDDYDPVSRKGTWTQLGAPIVTPGATAIFGAAAVLELGGRDAGTLELPAGRVLRAQLFSGIAAVSPIAVDFDPARFATGQAQAAMPTGETWTLAGGASIGRDVVAEDRIDLAR